MGNVGYAGMGYDSQTGLNTTPNREYDPVIARWLTQDPIVFQAGDPNLYRMVGNNFTNATDPSGLVVILLPGAFDKGDGWAPEFAKQLRAGWGALNPAAPIQRIYRFFHNKQDTDNKRLVGTADIPTILKIGVMREIIEDLQRLIVKLHTALEKEKEPIYIVAHSQGNTAVFGALGGFDKQEGIKPGSGRVAGLVQLSSAYGDRVALYPERIGHITGTLHSGAAAWAPNATVYVCHWPEENDKTVEYVFGDALVGWQSDVGMDTPARKMFSPKIQPSILTGTPTGRAVFDEANKDKDKLHAGSHDPRLAKALYAGYLVASGKSMVTEDQWKEIGKWAQANLTKSTLEEL